MSPAPKKKPAKLAVRSKARAKSARIRAGKVSRAKRRPRLELAPKPRSKRALAPRPSRSAVPGDGSAKQRMLFELVRSRAAVRSALRGLDAEAAERPIGAGKWNVRQIVLHLCLRDRARIRELGSTLRGETHSWADYSREETNRQNAADLTPLAEVSWKEALRLLGSTRHALRETLENVAAEPSEVWTPDHPFGRMLLGLPPHDVHHAEVITRWRREQGI